jgi:hypothetical protein
MISCDGSLVGLVYLGKMTAKDVLESAWRLALECAKKTYNKGFIARTSR